MAISPISASYCTLQTPAPSCSSEFSRPNTLDKSSSRDPRKRAKGDEDAEGVMPRVRRGYSDGRLGFRRLIPFISWSHCEMQSWCQQPLQALPVLLCRSFVTPRKIQRRTQQDPCPHSITVPAVPDSGSPSPAVPSACSSRPGPPCRPHARSKARQALLSVALAVGVPTASSRSRPPAPAAGQARGKTALRHICAPSRRAIKLPGPIGIALRRLTGRGLMGLVQVCGFRLARSIRLGTEN